MPARHPAGIRRIVTLLRPHASGERRGIVVGVLLSLGMVALHVLRPWPLKWMVDALAGHGSLPQWISGTSAGSRTMLALGTLFLVLAAAGAAAEYAQVMLLNGVGNRVTFRFRRALFTHLMMQPLAYHERREVGELLTRVVSDTARLRRGVNGMLVRVVQTLALFAASLGVVIWVAPMLGFVLAAAGAVAFAVMRVRGGRIARAARKQRRREGALAALVGNELAHVRELQFYGAAASRVRQRFARRNDRSLRQEQKVRRLAAGLTLRVDVVIALGLAIALGLGAARVVAGQLTAGDLVLFLSYGLALRYPFVDFAYQTARLGRTYACAERLARIIDRPAGIVDAPGAAPAASIAGALRLEGVSLRAPRTGSRKWTLRKLECEVSAGRRVAIAGENGAGKSSLLRLVARLVDPAAGRVLLDGRDLREWALESVRDQVSVVFQDAVFPGLTVREVIALGRPGADDGAIRNAAERARVHDFIARLPAGYDTVIRRGGNLFSGGERRRLALACAILRDGTLWLLDEPTTGLDQRTHEDIVDTLLDVTRGRTTLWVTHDPAIVRQMDQVLVLDHGRATFSGSPEAYLDWRAGLRQVPALSTHVEL